MQEPGSSAPLAHRSKERTQIPKSPPFPASLQTIFGAWRLTAGAGSVAGRSLGRAGSRARPRRALSTTASSGRRAPPRARAGERGAGQGSGRGGREPGAGKPRRWGLPAEGGRRASPGLALFGAPPGSPAGLLSPAGCGVRPSGAAARAPGTDGRPAVSPFPAPQTELRRAHRCGRPHPAARSSRAEGTPTLAEGLGHTGRVTRPPWDSRGLGRRGRPISGYKVEPSRTFFTECLSRTRLYD